MKHIIFQDVVSAAANYDHQQVTIEDCARMLTFITLLECCCKCLFAAILFRDSILINWFATTNVHNQALWRPLLL